MSSLVDTDFKDLWKGGMLSITSMIIMGFKWKKLRFRPSFRPGSVTESGGERSKRAAFQPGKGCSVYPSSTYLFSHSQRCPRKHRETLELQLEFPHAAKKSAYIPITLDQWFSSRDNCASQETFGNFRRHFWLSQRGKGIHNWYPMGRGQGCCKHPTLHRVAPQRRITQPRMSAVPGWETPSQLQRSWAKATRKKDGSRRSISGNRVWSCSHWLCGPSCSPADRGRWQERKKQGRKERSLWAKLLALLPFNLKHTFLITRQKGLEIQPFFSSRQNNPGPTKTQ